MVKNLIPQQLIQIETRFFDPMMCFNQGSLLICYSSQTGHDMGQDSIEVGHQKYHRVKYFGHTNSNHRKDIMYTWIQDTEHGHVTVIVLAI